MDKNTKKLFLYYSIGAAAVYFISMFLYTRFRLSAPLDDAFIYFQYAKNLAGGRFFEYVAGEGYSSGATSMLYAILLSPFMLFLKGSSVIFLTYFTGAACLFFTSYFIYLILVKLGADRTIAIFGAALYVTNGNFLWGYFSGMEIGLFSTLIAACMYYMVCGAPARTQALFLALLAMIRPEGFFLAVIFAMLKIINRLFDKKEQVLPYLMPVAAGLVYFVINRVFTGDFMPNTMRAKSSFSLNYYHLTEILRQGLDTYLKFILDIFNGGSEHWFPRYSLFVFILAVAPGAADEIKNKKASVFTTAFLWFFIGLLSTIFSSFATVHNYRYSMPFAVIFTVFLAYGLSVIIEFIPFKTSKQKAVYAAAISALFLCFNFFTIAANVMNFGKDCRDVYSQSISAGKWIKANIPPGERIAINDAGAATYYSDARVYDLVGLVTNGQAKIFRDGIGAVFEEAERVRPKYWMVHLGWFNYEGYTVFKKPRLNTFNIEKEPAYFVVGSPEVAVETDFTLFNSGDTMKLDHTEKGAFVTTDSLDVSDIRDEQKHGYRIWAGRPPNLPGTLFYESLTIGAPADVKVLEGGRITDGGEEFTVVGLTTGKDLKIVRRFFEPVPVKQEIYIDGQKAGIWETSQVPGYSNMFYEDSFTISGDFIKSKNVRLKLVEKSVNRYNVFHYWFMQRR
ncbi:MAG: hypothetical protein LLG37_07745 [Spirochaetia bacterium]|nr:hypothetical protein [Spirochaetia bacterium]